MAISMYAASVPVFIRALRNLDHVLGKGLAHAKARGFDPDVLVNDRLAPDMLPFKRQITIACDSAKLCVARVGGIDAPKFDDTETTGDELRARIRKTLDFLESVRPEQLDGGEDRPVTYPVSPDRKVTVTGLEYLQQRALPNMFFHVSVAYAILRHNGVPLGKVDFLAGPEG